MTVHDDWCTKTASEPTLHAETHNDFMQDLWQRSMMLSRQVHDSIMVGAFSTSRGASTSRVRHSRMGRRSEPADQPHG
jgi:hypothetical protein